MNSEVSASIWAHLDRTERAIIVGRPSNYKLAHGAVAVVQQELISSGARIGDLIGTMPEIRQRYGLGRWACREAISILEMRGWVESRRGVGGGLVVTLPKVHDLTKLMLVYLCLKGARTDQILEIRKLVHRVIVSILMGSGDARKALHHACRDGFSLSVPNFSCWLAAQTGNGVLELVMSFVTALHEECIDAPVSSSAVTDMHLLCEAICDSDSETATLALDSFLQSTEHLPRGERIALPGDFLCDFSGRASSSAARLARLLVSEIAWHDGPCAISLGTEADIGARHNVHHEVVRQAVRVLEDIGVVVPMRGGNGGLICRDPDLTAIIELIPPLLYQKNVLMAELVQAMTLLKREAAYLAAWRVRFGVASKKVFEIAGKLMHARPAQTNELITMESLLMDLAENSVLSALDRGLLLCVPLASPDFATHAQLANAAVLHMPQILQAIIEGEPEAAEAATLRKLRYVLPVHADNGRPGGGA